MPWSHQAQTSQPAATKNRGGRDERKQNTAKRKKETSLPAAGRVHWEEQQASYQRQGWRTRIKHFKGATRPKPTNERSAYKHSIIKMNVISAFKCIYTCIHHHLFQSQTCPLRRGDFLKNLKPVTVLLKLKSVKTFKGSVREWINPNNPSLKAKHTAFQEETGVPNSCIV